MAPYKNVEAVIDAIIDGQLQNDSEEESAHMIAFARQHKAMLLSWLRRLRHKTVLEAYASLPDTVEFFKQELIRCERYIFRAITDRDIFNRTIADSDLEVVEPLFRLAMSNMPKYWYVVEGKTLWEYFCDDDDSSISKQEAVQRYTDECMQRIRFIQEVIEKLEK